MRGSRRANICAADSAGPSARSSTSHPADPYDLVICYDVLQYLRDAEASRAIVNLGRVCRAALYVSALTTEDWQRELRPQPHRPGGAFAPRRMVSPPPE